jgi:hypothetical protein
MMNINHLRAGATTSCSPKLFWMNLFRLEAFTFLLANRDFSGRQSGERGAPFLLLSDVVVGNTLRLDFENAMGDKVPVAHCGGFVRSASAVGSRGIVFSLAPRPTTKLIGAATRAQLGSSGIG